MGEAQATIDVNQVGIEMYQFVAELYPICRSITGNGLRETLRLVQKHVPLELFEVPTGTQVFDWTVPKEWNISDAYVKNSRGDRVIDFQKSNLHVVNYSVPVRARMSLEDLRPHLFTLPEYPDWIPYRTSYYKETWGFCLTHSELLALNDEEYEVCIEASLEEGHLTYGECYLEGETPEEVLISCHACHPSLCNDNLSGVVLSTFLAKDLCKRSRRYSYRFIFIPGTIGSIAWLALNESKVGRIKHGLVLACVGDGGGFTYKKSRQGDAEVDRAMIHVLKHSGKDFEIMEFSPYGHDERQFCSPGFNLPMGCFMRTPDSRFAEYHTSADNLSFVGAAYLGESLGTCLEVIDVLENNKKYMNQNPKCEPHLGRRGLYRGIGGERDSGMKELTMLWVLNLSDGRHTLLDIAERAGLRFGLIKTAAEVLVRHGLLKTCEDDEGAPCGRVG